MPEKPTSTVRHQPVERIEKLLWSEIKAALTIAQSQIEELKRERDEWIEKWADQNDRLIVARSLITQTVKWCEEQAEANEAGGGHHTGSDFRSCAAKLKESA